MPEDKETLSLSQAPVQIPAKIIAHATSRGSREVSTQEISQDLLRLGVDPEKANYDHLKEVVGDAILPRVSKDETTETLAIDASKKAIEEFDINPDEIGYIIVATSTPSFMVPEPSKYVHRELGLSRNFGSHTISNACQGWVDAYLAASFMLASKPSIGKILVIGADAVSPHLRLDDPDTQAIFSDVASAYILGPSPEKESGIITYGSASDGSTLENFILGHGNEEKIEMKGRGVAKSILRLVPIAINNALTLDAKRQVGLSELKLIASHQPSAAMLEIIRSIVAKMGIVTEIPNNFYRLGNSSAATTPANLDLLIRENMLQRGDYFGILSAAVGSSALFLAVKY